MMMTERIKIAGRPLSIPVLIFSILFFFFSCQKNNSSLNKTDNQFNGDTELAVSELSRQIPVSREELKNWIPNQIGEFNIIKTIIGYKESVEMSAVKATYSHKNDTSKQVVLEILDGAGPVASILLSGSIQKLDLDFEELKADGFSRIHERNGLRVWEAEDVNNGISELEFIHEGRFLVLIMGIHLQHEELWVFADRLDLKGLD
jgi:hypothetical protein